MVTLYAIGVEAEGDMDCMASATTRILGYINVFPFTPPLELFFYARYPSASLSVLDNA